MQTCMVSTTFVVVGDQFCVSFCSVIGRVHVIFKQHYIIAPSFSINRPDILTRTPQQQHRLAREAQHFL